MKKNKNFLLQVGISNLSKKEVLEEIKKCLGGGRGFYQIVTVNPEIWVMAQRNDRLKKVLNSAQISTPDGIGILLAGKLLNIPFKERVTGVDLMKALVKIASDRRLTVGLIGARGDLALKTAECLKKTYPDFKFFALEGTKNIKKITPAEQSKIISIIHESKPKMLFVAFGAPWQEVFIDSLKKDLKVDWPIVAVGVGGAFDEISGHLPEMPGWLERIGFKWLWRLACQPWRWRRQLALFEFILLVIAEVLKKRRKNSFD